MVHVGLVELCAFRLLEIGDVVGRALLQALRGVAVLGRDAELLRERAGLLVDRGVVGDHLLREVLDLLVLAARLRDLAGVDVDLVRGDHDTRDLRVGGFALRQRERRHEEGDGQYLFPVHGVSLDELSRANTVATMWSQRAPAKLKASSQATSIFCASASRSRLRARKKRVRTVACGISSTAAVSSTDSSSTARSMNT